jgi:hypothetical protein
LYCTQSMSQKVIVSVLHQLLCLRYSAVWALWFAFWYGTDIFKAMIEDKSQITKQVTHLGPVRLVIAETYWFC